MTTIFFATDIHGSDICWNKFINAGKFYNASVLILGGDMTGKAIVPIVHQSNGTHRAVLLEQTFILNSQDELQQMIKKIRSRGYYPYLTNPDELAELDKNPQKVSQIFRQEVLKTAERWLTYADEKLKESGIRCFVSPGNDDMQELDNLIRTSKYVTLAEGKVIRLDDHHELISSGWSNLTPWHTYREESEEKLLIRYEAMLAQVQNPRTSIFNLHVPPYASSLDDAPELTKDLRPKYAGNSLIPVGSRAVRMVVERYQPLVGFFGHIHEARAATRIGKTLCINPGSMYEQGVLCGALVTLAKDRVKSYVLTSG